MMRCRMIIPGNTASAPVLLALRSLHKHKRVPLCNYYAIIGIRCNGCEKHFY